MGWQERIERTPLLGEKLWARRLGSAVAEFRQTRALYVKRQAIFTHQLVGPKATAFMDLLAEALVATAEIKPPVVSEEMRQSVTILDGKDHLYAQFFSAFLEKELDLPSLTTFLSQTPLAEALYGRPSERSWMHFNLPLIVVNIPGRPLDKNSPQAKMAVREQPIVWLSITPPEALSPQNMAPLVLQYLRRIFPDPFGSDEIGGGCKLPYTITPVSFSIQRIKLD